MSTSSCKTFRRALEDALSPGGNAQELGWHEHLLSCPDCRTLLQAEEALEELLATLPKVRLPDDLARRVLARLADVRAKRAVETELDRLLELDRPDVPERMADRVLSGLAGARTEARLDALIDLVPIPVTPSGLAERTLSALARERRPRARLRLLRGGGLRLAAAALILAGLGLVFWRAGSQRSREPDVTVALGVTVARGLVEDELLASLDVLENWDLLMSDDLDLLMGELDPVDWTLLEYGSLDPETEREDEERGG